MTWVDSHWGVIQLKNSSRLTGWHSRADCSQKDGENKTWILSLFFLHISSHMNISTYRKHRPRGPTLWKSCGYVVNLHWPGREIKNTVSLLWREEGYTIKYSLSQREILRATPKRFPGGSGYISLYIATPLTIQTFLITTAALTFLEINIGRVDYLYCSDIWAIWENVAQLIEQYWRVKF